MSMVMSVYVRCYRARLPAHSICFKHRRFTRGCGTLGWSETKGITMTYNRGRLIDHIGINVRNLQASRRFYAGALEPLGLGLTDAGPYFYVDELWFAEVTEGFTHLHLAFQAKDRATVDAFYKAALAAGGRDNGAPGERSYHPGYYAAFVLDPDGNNVEAVFHGPNRRSAASVEIEEL
jgi:catechol 2,3-dioxygenase-like lactoylglutathione lyase family enzyme